MSNALKDFEKSRSRADAGSDKISAYYLELQGLLDQIEQASTHYQVLGLKRSATKDELQLAYRRAVTLLHPGQYGINLSLSDEMMARTQQAFKRVSTAFSVLTNIGKRIEYDNSLRAKSRVQVPIHISGVAQQTRPVRKEAIDATQSLGGRTDSEKDKAGKPKERAGRDAAPRPDQNELLRNDQEVIVINHLPSQQAVFSKLVDDASDEDRRRCPRFNLSIPAYVTVYDRAGAKMQEIAQVINVGRFGIALRLSKSVQRGRVVHLSLPMPVKLRTHGYSDFRYGVYALVRWVGQPKDDTNLVGLEFIGEHPPAGFLNKPWATFEIKRNKVGLSAAPEGQS